MVTLKSPREIEIMKRSNQVVADVLCSLRKMIKPGVSTFELNEKTEEVITRHHAKAAFKGYEGFPASLCVSINDEIVHGIPSKKRLLKEGDIVSLDVGAVIDGYYGDAAITVPVGKVSSEATQLMETTQKALYAGISVCKAGAKLNEIARAIELVIKGTGYSIVRDLVGHGIGRRLHEPPEVPNYFDPSRRDILRSGMVLAIEPMINQGTYRIRLLRDKWTAVTADGKLSAHFEHSIAITENGPEILSWMQCYDEHPTSLKCN